MKRTNPQRLEKESISMDKTSDLFNALNKNINSQLVMSINQCVDLFYKNEYKLVLLPNKHIGICTRISTGAGSNSILVQNEPMIIEICGDDIEKCNLNAYPDRKNFPFEKFPHINYPIPPLPPSLCLTRENFRDWYAEHTFREYILLIKQWFSDASRGHLIKIKDEDFFEPFRIDRWDCILLHTPSDDKYLENAINPITICSSVTKKHQDVYYSNLCPVCSNDTCMEILLNRHGNDICTSWFIELPRTFGELLDFITKERFQLNRKLIDKKLKVMGNDVESLFFRLAFPRPIKVLDKTTRIDYLIFKVSAESYVHDIEDDKIEHVLLMDIANTDTVRYLSGTSDKIANKKILLLGAGAIGSKLAFHLYRSGICDLTLCDKDVMLSHNVCRHALSSYDGLKPKVELVKKELESMFVHDSSIKTVEEDLLEWLPRNQLNEYDLIIDTTASASVFRCLDEHPINNFTPIIHYALSDAGDIGLVYIHANNTSLLSDYYMHLARLAINDDDLSDWIKRERKYNYDWVRIGEGCHSNTMILSDDVISCHTAIASSIVRDFFDSKLSNKAMLSFINFEYVGQVFTIKYDIPTFVDIPCDNSPDWHVRIPQVLLHQIRTLAKVSGKKETGGYIMGNVDEKYKTIYVLHQFKPQNSKYSNTQLVLGTKGWKDEYDKVIKRTSSMINYIGDWHSHPQGSLNMSTIDMVTNYTIKTEEIPFHYGLCLITNSSKTKAHLLYPNIQVHTIHNEPNKK